MTITLTLAEALAQLRDYTADEVATLLTLAGKTGNTGDTLTCPMANYLEDVLGAQCAVDTNVSWLTSSGDSDTGDPITVDLPDGVVEFVRRFDSEHYPELITPEEY